MRQRKEDIQWEEAFDGFAKFVVWVAMTLGLCAFLIWSSMQMTGCAIIEQDLSQDQLGTTATDSTGPTPLPGSGGGGSGDDCDARMTFRTELNGDVLQSVTIVLGTPSSVHVTLTDTGGSEVAPTDLDAKVLDDRVALLRNRDERTLQFSGVAVGGTTAEVTQADCRRSLPILVLASTP